MKPQTPDEMRSLLFMSMLSRLYGDITAEARRRRLTEHDIETIERRVVELMRDSPDFSHEFQTFETEPVVAQVVNELKAFCGVIRAARIEKIKKG